MPTPSRAAAEGMPKPAQPNPLDGFGSRDGFDALVRRWRQCVVGPDRDAPFAEHEAHAASFEDLDIALRILAYPVPQGHLCTMRDKLDVVLHYASTHGGNLDPHERLTMLGITSLRGDIIEMGG